jgi:HTH-type transcriptional regulator/antitoxin HigA
MTADMEKRQYAKLLADTLPRVLKTEAEYEKALDRVEQLRDTGETLTPAERELLDLLAVLVEKYEAEHFEPLPDAEPHEVLAFLLEQHGKRPVDL